ncbi:MAG TPA: O-antigen ligase family protein [Candidatus Saccharimonadales bacterium]|nr:O-antigen ligase family protein [Candidatus Saccharimonadales bacterium]
MTSLRLQTNLVRGTVAVAAVIIVLVPFHAFLTVWAASVFGHYTALRLWKECLLAIITLSTAVLLVCDRALAKTLWRDWLIRIIGIYALLTIVTGLFAYHAGNVNKIALLDGLLLNLRFLLFFVIVWLATQRWDFIARQWRKLLLWPAAVVVAVGLLQRFVLPYDVLKHFGYGPQTIYPYETIDHKKAYLRIQSTLRGANPLGAYLAVIVTAALAPGKWLAARWRWLLAVAAVVVLVLSFSRSAWIGMLVSIFALVLLRYAGNTRVQKLALAGAVGLLIVLAGATLLLRNNDHFQNAFFHTDEHSHSRTSSNTGHFDAIVHGAQDIAASPLGRGAGTAGPASQHNNHAARIAENYFIQIGQETGILGTILYVAINCMVAFRLWLRRTDTLALVLLASLAGVTVINLLSHAWTDDTLAYVWWGLAGAAVALPLAQKREAKHAKD